MARRKKQVPQDTGKPAAGNLFHPHRCMSPVFSMNTHYFYCGLAGKNAKVATKKPDISPLESRNEKKNASRASVCDWTAAEDGPV